MKKLPSDISIFTHTMRITHHSFASLQNCITMHTVSVTHHSIASSATCTITFAAENDGTPAFEHRVPKTRARRAPFPPPRCGLSPLEHAGDMLHQCNYNWMSIPHVLFMAFLIICLFFLYLTRFDSCTDVISLQLMSCIFFSTCFSGFFLTFYVNVCFFIYLILSIYSVFFIECLVQQVC